jgi:hypothetical protein
MFDTTARFRANFCARSVTKVPRPRIRVISPSADSISIALRMVMRLTPKLPDNSASLGTGTFSG